MIDNVKIEAAARAMFVYNSIQSWDDGAFYIREHFRNMARAALAAAETIAPRQNPDDEFLEEKIQERLDEINAEAEILDRESHNALRFLLQRKCGDAGKDLADDPDGWSVDQAVECIAEVLRERPEEGHDEPCFYCGKPCSLIAGDPSRWPLAFAQPDGTGVVRYHHVGCVVARLVPSPAEMFGTQPTERSWEGAAHEYEEQARFARAQTATAATKMQERCERIITEGIQIIASIPEIRHTSAKQFALDALSDACAAIRALPTEEAGK